VIILYRRTKDDMPAGDEEIEQALAEGVRLIELAAPVRLCEENGAYKLVCTRMRPGAVDGSGRRKPEPVAGSEFTIEVDNIIASVGQRLDMSDCFGLTRSKNDFIEADAYTLETVRKGVFAGGDAVSGPSSVIEAISHGRQAAISIDKYLGGSGNIDESLASEEEKTPVLEEESEKRRLPAFTLSVEERLAGFGQVEIAYDEETALWEAGRCLRCDLEENQI
jgi:heterodisulfide reductase subunit A-like polyferredoxin